jgi:hypothetical protein
LKVPVLKTGVLFMGTRGSNPLPSALMNPRQARGFVVLGLAAGFRLDARQTGSADTGLLIFPPLSERNCSVFFENL